MFNKSYLTFYITVFLFLISFLSGAVGLIRWNDPKGSEAASLEVTLPILDWQTYSSLSKQYDDGRVEKTF